MLALQVVGITSLLLIVLAYNIYCLGGKYKRMGIDLFRGVLGADLLYIFLVLCIGLAPSNF